MQEPNFQPLLLNSRMYQYIRASAISNVNDALVELITNCVDAYSNIDNNPNKIIIKYSENNNYLEIIDQAIGMTGEKMKLCFLEVGTYVSNDSKRGHFSRGAKDISALGDCTFIAIKDNKSSSCKILYDGRGAMLNENIDVTDEIKNTTNIVDNGLYVRIDFKTAIFNDFKVDEFCYNYALRDILSNIKYEIKLINIDSSNEKVLKYNFPEGLLVIDAEYIVPRYNVPSKFTLYLISDNKPINYSNNMTYSENGILVSSNNTIYENTMLNNRIITCNPNSKKIFGRIHCDYINTLLKDYENNGPSDKNPFPVIDPSRLQGLNYNHPFVKNLIRHPLEKINSVFMDLDNKKNNNNIDNISKIFNNKELNKLNDEIFKKLDIDLIPQEELPQEIETETSKLPKTFKHSRRIQNPLEPSAKLSINFTDQTIQGKYETYANSTGIIINIPKTNYIVQNALSTPNASTSSLLKAHVADIISESFADIMTARDVSTQDFSSLTSTEILNITNSIYNTYYVTYSDKVHKIILG